MAILCKINKKYFMTMVFVGNFWRRDLIAVFGLVLWGILIKFADVNIIVTLRNIFINQNNTNHESK